MANYFYRKSSKSVGSSPVVVGSYTVQSNTTAIVIGVVVSNTTATDVFASVAVNDGVDDFYIVKDAHIAPGETLVPIGSDQKVVLNSGDMVRAISSTASSIDVTMSIMVIE